MSGDAAVIHSLSPAVADGIVSEESAFCGLSGHDVRRISERYPNLDVLVRLRSSGSDGRAVMAIVELERWSTSDEELIVAGGVWRACDIRDVTARAR